MNICKNCEYKKIGTIDNSFTHEFGIAEINTEVEFCELENKMINELFIKECPLKNCDKFDHFVNYYRDVTRKTLAKFLGITIIETYKSFPVGLYPDLKIK